jgi:uncharacterized protein YkwD
MPRFTPVVLAALALLVATPTAFAAAPTRAERSLLAAVNDARAARGLRAVRFAWPLQDRAHRHAAYLLRTDRFGHGSLSPGVRENLAWGTANAGGPRQIVRTWLRSPGHRANLLWRGARRSGVGVARGEFRGYADATVAALRLR